ncbi:MAG: glutamyl-tRNA reductase [Vampirovibrionales bacterium]|nr:glutamyl-tRNA reductase [Vampirovibrionales bacterium]
MRQDAHAVTQMAVVSVRHNRAPVALRETLSFSAERADAVMLQLKSTMALDGVVILSTCNRTELYIAAPKLRHQLPELYRQLAKIWGLSDFSQIRSSAAIYLNEDVVRHLCRVASGLDSMILGEDQILGQVKAALQQAQRLQTAGTVMDRVFKSALMSGRRVRQETGITHRDASLSHAALRLARHHQEAVLSEPVCILGAGKMVDILLGAFQSARREAGLNDPDVLQHVTIVNRSEKRLQTLVNRFGAQGMPWNQLPEALQNAKAIFVATGAPHPVIYPDMLPESSSAVTVIDMAVPRNIDQSVTQLPHVRLFNTDDLAAMAPELASEWMSTETMTHQIALAEDIVLEEVMRFCQWQQGLGGHQTLARLQARLNDLYEQAFQENTRHIQEDHRRLVHQASRQVMNQLLHEPFVQLRQLAQQSNQVYDQSLTSLRQLFAL